MKKVRAAAVAVLSGALIAACGNAVKSTSNAPTPVSTVIFGKALRTTPGDTLGAGCFIFDQVFVTKDNPVCDLAKSNGGSKLGYVFGASDGKVGFTATTAAGDKVGDTAWSIGGTTYFCRTYGGALYAADGSVGIQETKLMVLVSADSTTFAGLNAADVYSVSFAQPADCAYFTAR